MNNPDTKLLYEELLEEINKIIYKLPERTKEIFLLSRLKGQKNIEISEQLGISTKTVEKHITIALKMLRKSISDYSKSYIILLFLLLADTLKNIEIMNIN